MTADELSERVATALDDHRAVDIKVLDVRGATAITDAMVIASGNSDRHVKALTDVVLKAAQEAGIKPLGMEGESGAEWVLIDLNDIIVHLMVPAMRDFYNLEKLWRIDTAQPEQGRPLHSTARGANDSR